MIEGYRRISGPEVAPDGYPLPLTFKPLTKHPVVVKKEGVELKQYPERFFPGKEELGADGLITPQRTFIFQVIPLRKMTVLF